MSTEEMRLSPAKLLIVVAIAVVVLIELRTVLAFFSVDIAPVPALVLGVVIIAAIVLWATFPVLRRSRE